VFSASQGVVKRRLVVIISFHEVNESPIDKEKLKFFDKEIWVENSFTQSVGD